MARLREDDQTSRNEARPIAANIASYTDIAVLDWIAAEGRRQGRSHLPI